MWTEVGALVIGGIVTELGRVGIQSWRGKRQELDQWYDQSISLASHGMGICDSARKRSELNYGQISDEAKKISERLNKQVNPYPSSADKKAVSQIKELSEVFSKLAAIAEASSENPADESVDEILAMSQRESKDQQDMDMGETMEASKEYSPIMNNILSRLDSDVEEFGPKMREELENADSIVGLIETMGDQLGASSTFIERGIEKELEDDWDENLSIGIRMYLQISSNLCTDVINYLSETSGKSAADRTI